MTHLDMDLARTFVAICESGNFSRAAEVIGRTPSAVSLQVKKLEDVLGRPLFQRDSRSVALTPDGETLLDYARRLLALNDEALQRFRTAGIAGRVRIGAPGDSGAIALPDILRRFAASHPGVEVEVRLDGSASLLRRCREGNLDLAIFSDSALPPPDSVEIHTEELVWVGLHHGCAKDRTPLPLAVADPGCAWRGAALAALDDAGLDYRVAYSSEQCQGQIAAVRADLAIAPLPMSVVASPLTRIDGLPRIGAFRVFLYVRPSAGEAVRALAAHVAAGFRDLAGCGARLFA
ncbi:putative transcriptional regulator, LysR family [uncultured Alphaproteobacteria bacterium]|uniref:Putative transcriptional regulator, LysR family n=1 Tax=uncultured Alphaproteobacteria bacterium TaxID=91750 RepID=A0A212KB02_9PROT|nr:putative transcriptional regulator, LysR family [uncultured Alphaproteobacteria bacterium]